MLSGVHASLGAYRVTPLEPADVVRAVADGVSRLVAGGLGQDELERQFDELAALYAETTDVRHPFAPTRGSRFARANSCAATSPPRRRG